MVYRSLLFGILTGVVAVAIGAATVRADDLKTTEVEPAKVCAQTFWKISDVVLDHHIDPPSRQEMFLGGVRAVLAKANVAPAADLSRQVSRLGTEEQFTTFLKETWSKSEKEANPAGNLTDAFLRGMAQRIPGVPGIIPAPQARVLEQGAANRYVGTGIQIGVHAEEKLTQIHIPFPGGPARKAGARPGDLIVEVDGKSMAGLRLVQVVDRLRGEEGTKVSMTVRQPGSTERRVLHLTRLPIAFETAVGYQRTGEESWKYRLNTDEPIAYIKLDQALPSTPMELRKAERAILADGIKAVVLDLRFSGGATLHAAGLTADALLDGGTMWRVRDGQNRIREFRADRDCVFRDCRLAVLVNEHTHDGIEFVAAALQDAGRAVVIGEPTKGDGYSTSLIQLPDGLGAMQLRTSRVERVGHGKDAEKAKTPGWRPVEPEHVVKLDQKQMSAVMSWQRAQMSPEPRAGAPKSPPADPQLAKAVELLREAIKK